MYKFLLNFGGLKKIKMQKMKYILFSLCCLLFATESHSQTNTKFVTGEYLKKTFAQDGNTLNYRIMYPNDFDNNKKYPVVLFLHGMGERGADNEKQLTHGSKFFRDSLDSYPAIVIFPQCPVTDYWANLSRPDEGGASRNFTFYYDKEPNPTMKMVITVITDLMAEPYTDDSRLYVSGLSMGGFGAFEFSYRLQDRVAAALPICGGGPRDKTKEMTQVPYWIFHGVKDDVVNPRFSIGMTRGIQQAGGKAKITIFPNANHNSWDPAFNDPEYLSWMFSKRRVELK